MAQSIYHPPKDGASLLNEWLQVNKASKLSIAFESREELVPDPPPGWTAEEGATLPHVESLRIDKHLEESSSPQADPNRPDFPLSNTLKLRNAFRCTVSLVAHSEASESHGLVGHSAHSTWHLHKRHAKQDACLSLLHAIERHERHAREKSEGTARPSPLSAASSGATSTASKLAKAPSHRHLADHGPRGGALAIPVGATSLRLMFLWKANASDVDPDSRTDLVHFADVSTTASGATALLDRLHTFCTTKSESIPPLLLAAEERAGEEDLIHGGRAEILWSWVALEMEAAGGNVAQAADCVLPSLFLHAGRG